MPHSVLIVDDEKGVRESLSLILEMEGFEVTSTANPLEALKLLDEGNKFSYIISDVRMPEMDGIKFLHQLKSREVSSNIIMISAYGNVETSIEAIKNGATDYLNKPINSDELILRLRMIEERNRLRSENLYLKKELGKEEGFEELVYSGEMMKAVVNFAKRVSEYKTTVLIVGESGTGKEILAHAIHKSSPRQDKPFVAVNCSAIPETLFESELFGYVKGAFSGASSSKTGLFEEADGGTLFLDEIGEFPPALQPKLLRALQEEEIRRLGDTKTRKVDVRIIAATSHNLAEDVQQGSFRDDLYYRLNVVPITIPPLRDRAEDIPKLIKHFIQKYNMKFGKHIEGIAPSIMPRLMEHPWKGNVRELENTIERAIILADSDTITKIDLSESAPPGEDNRNFYVDTLSLDQSWHKLEYYLITKALKETGNNRTKAAKLLEVSRRALQYKLKQYGMLDDED
ncbi:MAG: sigma-54-dependent Fis family transcriptional regulator [Candidatus Dadabacteria bacterium]|nr:sigma-54-dependent Fis family transcriptional regulator [Candidatus Dadabacteria bacterium]